MSEPEFEGCDTAPLPGYSADGVDLSLIRWSLSLSPAERLAFWKTALRISSESVLSMRESSLGVTF